MDQKTARQTSTTEIQRLQDKITRLEQMLTDISISNTGETFTRLVTTSLEQILPPILQTTITEGLSRSKEAHQEHQEPLCRSHTSAADDIMKSGPASIIAPEKPGSGSSAKRRKRVYAKRISTPFGYVTLRCCLVYVNDTAIGPSNNDHTWEFRLTVVPCSSLLRKVSVVTGTWSSKSKFNLTGLNLQSHPVVDFNSPIIKACQAGDIATIRQLFQNKMASPYDIDEGGKGLLSVSTCNSKFATSNYSYNRVLWMYRILAVMKRVNSF